MASYSKSIRKRFGTHGPNQGYCAICRKLSPLTKDHVPPKDCGNTNDSVISALYPDHNQPAKKSFISQGGMHFKSLCSYCNSTLLGTLYDPSLSKVVNDVNTFLINAYKSGLILPSMHYFEYHPNKFLRSIVGHLLAAHAWEDVNSYDRTTPLDEALRKYFLDESSKFPDDIHVYYWLYPYRRRVFMKHAAMGFMGSGGNIIYGHIIKFFPFGFWFVHDDSPEIRKKNWKINMRRLLADNSKGIEAVNQLAIDLQPIHSKNFPEAPPDNGMWLVSDDLTSSVEDRTR